MKKNAKGSNQIYKPLFIYTFIFNITLIIIQSIIYTQFIITFFSLTNNKNCRNKSKILVSPKV